MVSLCADVSIAGLTGDDADGLNVINILNNEAVKTDNIIKDKNRPTTVKTRVLAGSHQLVRIDREITDEISTELEDELIDKLSQNIAEADIILLSDYNKGLLSPTLTPRIIKLAAQHNKKVIIDPKGLNYEKYKGAFLIKPNRKELAEAAKVEKIKTIADVENAAQNNIRAY